MKLLLVEDYYGTEFHRTVLHKLQNLGIVDARGIEVRRVPAKECNVAMVRKIKAILFPEIESSKIVIVIDSEGNPPSEAAKRVRMHFEKDRGIDSKRVRGRRGLTATRSVAMHRARTR